MGYQIKWDERAYRELRKIETKEAVDILNAINKLYEDPEKSGKALSGKFRGKFRIRVGDYRVLYWVESSYSTVWIVSVKHRKNAYKKQK